jgi:hypothetical protein
VLVDGPALARTTALCARCRATFEVPTDLNSEQRTAVSRLVQQGRALDAIRLLREISRLTLEQAKVVVTHLTGQGPTCHRCRASIPNAGMPECAKCRSLNINWP